MCRVHAPVLFGECRTSSRGEASDFGVGCAATELNGVLVRAWNIARRWRAKGSVCVSSDVVLARVLKIGASVSECVRQTRVMMFEARLASVGSVRKEYVFLTSSSL